jgi:hypothetical protein
VSRLVGSEMCIRDRPNTAPTAFREKLRLDRTIDRIMTQVVR